MKPRRPPILPPTPTPSTSSSSGRLTVTPPPEYLYVPGVKDFMAQEGDPVVDSEKLAWAEISQISKHLRGLVRAANNQAAYVRQIPEIKEDVRAAKDSAAKANQSIEVATTRIGAELKGVERRLEKVEDRGHDCAQEAIITELRESSLETRRKVEHDVQEGVKTRERLETTRTDLQKVDTTVQSISTARRNFWMGLLGFFIFGLSTAGSLVWFLAGLSAQVEEERQDREEGYRRLENQLQQVGKVANTAPVQQDLQRLERTVKAVGTHELMEDYCSGLSDVTVRNIKRTVPVRDWPRCRRFGVSAP